MTQDRWAALVCLLFGGFLVVTMPYQTSARSIPGARGFDILDGAFFPKIAVGTFLLSAVWMFVRGRPKIENGQPESANGDAPTVSSGSGSSPALGAHEQPPGLSLRALAEALGLTVLVLIYVQLLAHAGYLLATIPTVALFALICGQRSLLGLLLSAFVFPLVVYFLFSELFSVPLPRVHVWIF